MKIDANTIAYVCRKCIENAGGTRELPVWTRGVKECPSCGELEDMFRCSDFEYGEPKQ